MATSGPSISFDTGRFLDRARGVDTGDIDWVYVARVGLTDDEARCLRYMARVERHAVFYLRDLLAGHTARDPEIVAFLSCWAFEETQHGRALDRFLEVAGRGREVSRAPAAASSRWRELLEGLAARGLARATPHFIATHMAWGATNEMTAALAYTKVSRFTQNRELAKLAGRLAKDERRHQSFYYSQAEARLARSRAAQRLARFALEQVWSPVGDSVGDRDDFGFIGALLFDDAAGREALRQVDRAIARLPGMDRFDRVSARVEAHIARFKLGAAGRAATIPLGPPRSTTQ
jgi:rubrerythrin